ALLPQPAHPPEHAAVAPLRRLLLRLVGERRARQLPADHGVGVLRRLQRPRPLHVPANAATASSQRRRRCLGRLAPLVRLHPEAPQLGLHLDAGRLRRVQLLRRPGGAPAALVGLLRHVPEPHPDVLLRRLGQLQLRHRRLVPPLHLRRLLPRLRLERLVLLHHALQRRLLVHQARLQLRRIGDRLHQLRLKLWLHHIALPVTPDSQSGLRFSELIVLALQLQLKIAHSAVVL
ncbi:Os05g0122650, partial [Oryza sativa Japonica Group]